MGQSSGFDAFFNAFPSRPPGPECPHPTDEKIDNEATGGGDDGKSENQWFADLAELFAPELQTLAPALFAGNRYRLGLVECSECILFR